jgi:hypothetical protein
MVKLKTATLTLGVNRTLKEALHTAADQEHRSVANMVEVLARNHCEQQHIAILSFEEKKYSSGTRS